MNRGKLVIVLMIALSVVSALFAIWFRHQWGSRSLEFWGRDAALLIRDAPQVAACRLRPPLPGPPASGQTIHVDGQSLECIDRLDISRARGLLHVRQALQEDRTFDWAAGPDATPADWTYALIFAREQQRAIVLIDGRRRRMRLARDGASEVSVAPAAQFLERFLESQFRRAAPAA